MQNTGLSPSDIEHIKKTLSQYPCIETVILFGSRAKGSHKKGSDIDIAIKFSSHNHPPIQLIHDALEEKTPLPYFFDVLDMDTIENTDLLEHINRVGLPISQL